MSERLTDEELESIATGSRNLIRLNETAYVNFDALQSARRQLALVAELRERRAADLSDEDKGALTAMRNQLRNSERRSPDIMYYPIEYVRAREALDRLLSRGKDGR